MKKKMKRTLSLLLCLVMVLGLLPAMTPVAEAVSPTSWSELVAYLTDPSFQSIFLDQDISHVAGENEDPTVTIVGDKFLNLNGHELIVDDDSNAVGGASLPSGSEQLDRTLFTIPAGASLEVIDQPAYVDSGKGKIRYDGYMADANKAYHACWRNLFDVSGTLIIHSGIFEAGRTLKQWYPMVNNFTQQIFGKVINARDGSTVFIHDGTFIGHGYVPESDFVGCNTEELRSAVIDFPSEGRATVYINGGNFYARGGANVFGTYERPVYGEDYTGSAYSVLEVKGGYFEVEDLGDIRVESPGLPYDASGNGGRLGIQARNLYENLSLVQLAFHYKDDSVISGGYERGDQIDETHLHTRLYAGYEVESVAISPWPEMSVWHELNVRQTLYEKTVEPEYLAGHRMITMQSYHGLVYGESDPNSVTLSWDADDLEDAQYYFYNDGSGLSSDPTVKYRWDIYKERTSDRVAKKVNNADQDPDYVIYTDEPSLSLQNAVCNGEIIDWNESFWWIVEPYVEETHPYGNVAVRNDDYIYIYMDYLRIENLTVQINDVSQLTDKDVYYVDFGDKIRLDYRRLKLHPDLADDYHLLQEVHLYYMDGEYEGYQAEPWVSYVHESMKLVIENTIMPITSAPKQPEKNTMEFVFSTAESEPEELTGSSIVYATGVTVDNAIALGITPAGSLLHKLVMLQNSPVQYQWQVSQNGKTGWTDLEGATMGSGFVPSAYGVKVGDYIRVKATALHYKGEICSNAAQVGGNNNGNHAPNPKIKIVNETTAVIENYDPAMEYVWSTISVDSAAEFEKANSIEEDRFDPPAYGFYYVAGRYKATESTFAGTHIPCVGFSFSDGTGTDISPTYLRYPDLGTSSGVAQTVYVEKGSSVKVNYCYDPVEANFGLAPYFVSDDPTVAFPTGKTNSYFYIASSNVGTVHIYPAKNADDKTDTWSEAHKRAQQLTVVVYDPANPTVDVLQDTNYADYTLRVGDTYEPQNPKEAGYPYAPTKGLEEKFDNFRWYFVESTLTGYKLTTENEYAVIDTVTGKVTAKAVTPAEGIQVEVYAFRDGQAPTGNTYNGKGGRVGWYRLKVVNSERITLEGVRILPEALSLEVGETYQLKAVPSPLNASVTTTSWTKTGMAISLKDGLVTALKPGQSNVTVKLIGAGAPGPDGVTYTIPITVYAADHVHEVDWETNGSRHWGACTICGEEFEEECDRVETVLKEADCHTAGRGRISCDVCGYEYEFEIAGKHEYGAYSCNEVYHWQDCLVCGERKGEDNYYGGKYKHSYADREFCSVCGYKQGSDVGGMGASDEPMVEGSYAITGTTATVTPVVSNLADDFIVTVMVAQYSSTGQMKDMQLISHTGNGPVSVPETFTHASGDVYKAFLVLPGTYEWAPWVPMSEAKLLTEGAG